MSTVPPVSRRVLDALRPHLIRTAAPSATVQSDAPVRPAEPPSPVAGAFISLETALTAHTAALAALDRLEEAVVTAHGYPRVALPNMGTSPTYATDAATIQRHLSPGPAAHALTAELRSRQANFFRAAHAAGLDAARAHEVDTAAHLSSAANKLLLTTLTTAHTDRADLALKLKMLIAAGEHTPDDALTFPWLHLRALLADLHQFGQP